MRKRFESKSARRTQQPQKQNQVNSCKKCLVLRQKQKGFRKHLFDKRSLSIDANSSSLINREIQEMLDSRSRSQRYKLQKTAINTWFHSSVHISYQNFQGNSKYTLLTLVPISTNCTNVANSNIDYTESCYFFRLFMMISYEQCSHPIVLKVIMEWCIFFLH